MRLLIGLMCLLMITGGYAKEPLTVIYDSGDTLPIEPYLPKRMQQDDDAPKKERPQLPFSLPIITPSMQPGVVTVTPKALRYLLRPLFLIGSDQRSKEWLLKKREHLQRIGAVGLLIEAKDRAEVEHILELAKGLRVVPASAESFATRLGLSHYPILLSKEGWEQ